MQLVSLTVGVFLTGLLFTACQPQGGTAPEASTSAATTQGPSIVFIRLDSLQNGYAELVTELERLQENAAAADENIQKELAKLQREAQRIQNKIQRGEMTPKMIQQEQQRMAASEQKIAQQRDMALSSIQQDQIRLQQQFGERVKEILEAIQEEKGYDYILNEGGGSGVLLGNDKFDITDMVLERLNASEPITSDTLQ